MANNPPTVQVVRTQNGTVQVFPLLPTQILGTQIGADVGTGTSNEPTTFAFPAGQFVVNNIAEFLDDSYCLHLSYDSNQGATYGGIFKRDNGGTDQWGRVLNPALDQFRGYSGLHVIHPAGVPTLAAITFSGPTTRNARALSSTDGTTWNDINIDAGSGTSPGSVGQSIAYRDSIFLCHELFTSSNGPGTVIEYDFRLAIRNKYDPTNGQAGAACTRALCVHKNKVFLWAHGGGGNQPAKLFRLDSGSFVEIYDSTAGGDLLTPSNQHSVMFTDPTTGDLIVFGVGQDQFANAGVTVLQFSSADTGTPTAAPTDITSTVLGSTEGADKYAQGGGSASLDRRWSVYVDNDTAPTAPRVFLWTWVPAGVTECWEWVGVGAEIEAVASLAGISDDFSLPYQLRGGGLRNVGGAARVELSDVSNPPEEVAGGTKFYFRVYGSGGPVTMTLYYDAEEEFPSNIATLTGSVTVESGSPSTIPSRSGNTIVNLTADDGATLYSFIHDATNDGLGEGDTYTLVANVT